MKRVIVLNSQQIKRLEAVRKLIKTSMPQYPGAGQLSKTAHMNVSDMNRRFKFLFGVPPFQYFCSLRMAKAQELLQSSTPVGKVALELDYSSPRAFGKAYKKWFGCVASEKNVRPAVAPCHLKYS